MIKRNLVILLVFILTIGIVSGYIINSNLYSQNTPVPSTSPTTSDTPIPSVTPSISVSSAPSATFTPTISPIPTVSVSSAPSATFTPTISPIPTVSVSSAPSATLTPSVSPTTTPNTGNTDTPDENKEDHEESSDYTWVSSEIINIVLNGNSISVNPTIRTIVDGSKVTIISAGTYKISGSLTNGQIIVDTADQQTVRLILSNANISCSTSAPISVNNAEKVLLILEENTKNYVTDGTSYVFPNGEENEPNAAIFSKCDLTIFGAGSLNVEANYNDGIASKDGLIIKSGTITVNALDDGIRGKDYLIIKEGSLTLNVDGDGLKSDNTEDATAGYVSVESGVINITSSKDAIDAETDVIILGGTFTLTSGGGSTSITAADVSAKGIKGSVSVIIYAGTFTINSADDAVHSNGKVIINGGSFTISTGDDAFHGDSSLTVNGGNINIIKSFEGLESAVLTINNGNIQIESSDDGLNCAGGTDGSSTDWMPRQGGIPGPGGFGFLGNYNLTITGGFIYINSYGDGIDINGKIEMSGGTLIINGPTENMNGAIDYDSSFKITGGRIIAVGSVGMAMAPSPISTQYSVLVRFNSVQSANTIINIQTTAGEEIITFRATKTYQSIVISSSELTPGSYIVYLGGSSTGNLLHSIYENGTYTAGTKYANFTISGIITNVR